MTALNARGVYRGWNSHDCRTSRTRWALAMYLRNRTPKSSGGLTIALENLKPQQVHLKVYNCKAFAPTIDALQPKKANHLQRLDKAWIVCLAGCDSSNTYKFGILKSTRCSRRTFNGDVKERSLNWRNSIEERTLSHLNRHLVTWTRRMQQLGYENSPTLHEDSITMMMQARTKLEILVKTNH